MERKKSQKSIKLHTLQQVRPVHGGVALALQWVRSSRITLVLDIPSSHYGGGVFYGVSLITSISSEHNKIVPKALLDPKYTTLQFNIFGR